jgi:thiamine pyrophosphate-dependent acetolactate synthase large subunit-like protein
MNYLESHAEYGSDIVVEMLRAMGVEYYAANPGASWRGLHDSLVNFGEGGPEMLLACHEEIAVAMAHGYAQASGKLMAAIVHDIVGLQHASMAIFNAWCDRVPLLVLGGTGPMDTRQRRPWIDWVHTALVQGEQVRDYVKWDDQPASVEAIPESLLRAYRIAMTEPRGPVYVCLDAGLQEEQISTPLRLPDPAQYQPAAPPGPNPEALREAARLLVGAELPVIVAESVGRNPAALPALSQLSEVLGAAIIDRGARFNVPTTHPLDLTLDSGRVLREADVILALDVDDLEATFSEVGRDRSDADPPLRAGAKVISISLTDYVPQRWVVDIGRIFPIDLAMTANTAVALPLLVDECRRAAEADSSSASRVDARRSSLQRRKGDAVASVLARAEQGWGSQPISTLRMSGELWEAARELPSTRVNGRAMNRAQWTLTEPVHYLGGAGGGGGVGFSAGGAMGAAVALRDRICISVMGDGDLLYTPSALWSAAHHQIPVLMVIHNNRAYFQDEGHQAHMAEMRGRPVENRMIGIEITQPNTDFATLAKAFDVEAWGPIEHPDQLGPALKEALKAVQEGRPALVDVVSQPR